ncbi:hypothetical protein [Saccharopolyspora sp. 5N708]|uniref:hypothetical protein n=1 Tax=Saccharopolyspora sp. 5N708 TaxID=3457424 RepID=UPI003FD65347
MTSHTDVLCRPEGMGIRSKQVSTRRDVCVKSLSRFAMTSVVTVAVFVSGCASATGTTENKASSPAPKIRAVDTTAGSPVSAVTISEKVVGKTDYVVKEITITPGGTTGWHYHPGLVFGVVKQGVLTHNMSNCSVDGVYDPGRAIAERSGADYVHIGRNLGTTPVVLDVVYENPVGSPLAVNMANPDCPFQ